MIKKAIVCFAFHLTFFSIAGVAVEPGYIYAYTKKIIVQNRNVFVLGGRNSNVYFSSHGFWHNGNYIKVEGRARLNSMHVQGNYIYIVGKLKHHAAFWIYRQTKNGWAKDHTITFIEGELFDVKSKNLRDQNIVYLSGVLDERDNKSGRMQPYLWTFEHHILTDQLGSHKLKPLCTKSRLNCIPLRLFIENNKKVVVGMAEYKPKKQRGFVVWKDDRLLIFPTVSGKMLDAEWINGKLYAVGYILEKGQEQAAYWIDGNSRIYKDGLRMRGITIKNGNPLMIGHDKDGSDFYWYEDTKFTILKPAKGNEVYSVTIDGDDMYIAGRLNDYRPYYSKNGKLVKLYFGSQDTWE